MQALTPEEEQEVWRSGRYTVTLTEEGKVRLRDVRNGSTATGRSVAQAFDNLKART